MANAPKVSVIILNWNQPRDTIACIKSVQECHYPCIEITVVDNGSLDDSVGQIRRAFPTIEIIENTRNLGYAGGNNIAIRKVLGGDVKYVLLLNDDIVVDENALTALVAAMDDRTVVAAGGKVRLYEAPTHLWAAGEGFSRANHWPLDDERYDTSKEIDFAVGCSILLRAETLNEIGLFDEAFFAYFEEMEWCYRARDAGYRILYVPEAVFYHRSDHSASATGSAIYHYLNTRNWLYFWELRGEIPRNWRRSMYMLVVWWHEIKFVWKGNRSRLVRSRAVTHGACDFLRRRFGPPPKRWRNARQ